MGCDQYSCIAATGDGRGVYLRLASSLEMDDCFCRSCQFSKCDARRHFPAAKYIMIYQYGWQELIGFILVKVRSKAISIGNVKSR